MPSEAAPTINTPRRNDFIIRLDDPVNAKGGGCRTLYRGLGLCFLAGRYAERLSNASPSGRRLRYCSRKPGITCSIKSFAAATTTAVKALFTLSQICEALSSRSLGYSDLEPYSRSQRCNLPVLGDLNRPRFPIKTEVSNPAPNAKPTILQGCPSVCTRQSTASFTL